MRRGSRSARSVLGGLVLGLLACRPGSSGETAPRGEEASASAGANAGEDGPEVAAPGVSAGAPDGAADASTPEADGADGADGGQPSGPNEAAQLVAQAERITGVRVVDADRKPLGELPPKAVDELRKALTAGPAEDLTFTTPPWDIALQVTVDGALAFVAIPVGIDRARLNPSHPYDARYADDEGQIDPRVQEVVVSEAVHEAIRALVGPPDAKDFQVAPPRKRTSPKSPTSLDAWYEQQGNRRPEGK